MRNTFWFIVGLLIVVVILAWSLASGQDASVIDPLNITGSITVSVDPDDLLAQTTVISVSSAETTVVTTGGSGIFRDIVTIIASNQDSADLCYTLRDATAGSTVAEWCLTGQEGTYTYTNSAPIVQTTANNNWTLQLSQAKTSTVLMVFRERT